jgi:putative transposase
MACLEYAALATVAVIMVGFTLYQFRTLLTDVFGKVFDVPTLFPACDYVIPPDEIIWPKRGKFICPECGHDFSWPLAPCASPRGCGLLCLRHYRGCLRGGRVRDIFSPLLRVHNRVQNHLTQTPKTIQEERRGKLGRSPEEETRTMPKKGHTEEHLVAVLRQVEAGPQVAEICRKVGISQATYCLWKRPHRSLGERTPYEFARQIAASRDLSSLVTAGD